MEFNALCEVIHKLDNQHRDHEHMVIARFEHEDGSRPGFQGEQFCCMAPPAADHSGGWECMETERNYRDLDAYRTRHGDWFCATLPDTFRRWWDAEDMRYMPNTARARVYKVRREDVLVFDTQVVFHHRVAERLYDVKAAALVHVEDAMQAVDAVLEELS